MADSRLLFDLVGVAATVLLISYETRRARRQGEKPRTALIVLAAAGGALLVVAGALAITG